MVSNADIVRGIILAQNNGEDDRFVADLDPDIEFHTVGTGTEPATVVRGRDAVRQAVVEGRKQVGSIRITLHEVEEAGDAVLVIGSISAANGLRMPRAWIWELRDGKAVRADTYTGREAALRAWRARG